MNVALRYKYNEMRRNAAKILQINCQKVSEKERGMREGCREGGEGYATPPATLAQEQQREKKRKREGESETTICADKL